MQMLLEDPDCRGERDTHVSAADDSKAHCRHRAGPTGVPT
jgi:hypothetical protein